MSMTFKELKTRDAAAICATYGRYPLAMERASGDRLYDLDGREYVDLLSGIAVTALGHSHPELVAVMREQAEKLIHVSNLFYQPEQVLLAEALKATCHAGKVFFCNSGAEANEAAIKLARRYARTVKENDAYEVVTLSGSFHGRTLAAMTATGQDKIKHGFDPLPEGFVHVPFGDLDALAAAVGPKTCAILVEMVQGEGGVRPLDPAYASGVAELCRERGVLLVVDEIQTGLGRTGRMWAHQHYSIEPDIFTTAKALAGGLPMGAMLATDEVARGFTPGAHATTFGGGGVLSAVARKNLEIIERDSLAQRAERVGAMAQALFRDVQARLPDKIADVRGLGLMLGIELTFPGQDVWRALLERGFVLNLTQERTLRLLPSLLIAEDDLRAFAIALEEVLSEAQSA